MVPFDLALCHRMVGRAARVGEAVGLQVGRQFRRDVTGAVVAQQPRPMDDRHAIDAGRRARQIERLHHVVAPIDVRSVHARM